jgi:hypothetical protein
MSKNWPLKKIRFSKRNTILFLKSLVYIQYKKNELVWIKGHGLFCETTKHYKHTHKKKKQKQKQKQRPTLDKRSWPILSTMTLTFEHGPWETISTFHKVW